MSTTMRNEVILIKLTHGGYVVKQYDPACGYTEYLFAGDLEHCLTFMANWMRGNIQQIRG
jgi:hypothetical protein